MKTIKQIADDLGIDKQKVYRYIKKHDIKDCINESNQKSNVKYYDDVAESLIKQGILENSESNEVHQECINDAVIETLMKHIETLENELEKKNEQLSDALKLVNQSQQLHALAENKIKLLEAKAEEESTQQEKKKWWHFWK